MRWLAAVRAGGLGHRNGGRRLRIGRRSGRRGACGRDSGPAPRAAALDATLTPHLLQLRQRIVPARTLILLVNPVEALVV
jgi:hypothetical protein